MKKYILFPLLLLIFSCYNAERKCADFKTGKFYSETTFKGKKFHSVSIRTDSLVIETFNGKTDTSSVRWISDCEFVVQKLHPKTMLEKKAIDIKILTTSKNSYTFEFGVVGDDKKQRGTAKKI